MNVTQIQIAPVENGFVIQVVALDGEGGGRKLVSTSLDDCRKQLHALADQFHVKQEKPAKAVVAPPATPSPAKPA